MKTPGDFEEAKRTGNPDGTMEKEIVVFPTSFAQQRLWFLDRLEPGNSTYNVAQAFRLTGQLQRTALERSLNEIVRRHETLRTTFVEIEGEPAQIIGAPSHQPLNVIDLLGIPAGKRESEAERLLEAEAHRPFDLAKGPLFRAVLFRLDEEENILLFVMHHIVSDGWSMAVLYRELSALYEAFCQGKVASLPELPIQYADFAVWQREYLAGGIIETELDYWKKQLAGMPLDLTFPGSADPALATGRQAERQLFSLSKILSDALRALGRQGEATLFMTLLAAFYVWLRRYTGQEDIVIGSPVAGRNRAEIEGLIGFFVNTLLLRADLSGDITFRELLSQVRTMCLEALTNQNVPYEKLVAALPRRSARQDALVQAAFAFQTGTAPLRLSGLTTSRMNIKPGAAKLELTLFMWDEAEGLAGALEYDTGLFNDRAVARMIGDFHKLLEAIVADPERRLSELAPVIAPTARPDKKREPDIYERANLTKNQLLVWLGQKLQPEVPLYNVAVAFEFSGKIDPLHFRRAFQTLVDSSDTLRTVIEETGGVPQQKVLDRLPYEMECLDFSAAADPEAALEEWVERRCRVLFDLRNRLFDSALIKIAGDRFVWYWNQHHIVTDGAAILVIYRHMSEFYGRSLEGRLDDMVALPRFQDYVEYERERRASPRYAETEAYWEKQLAEKAEPLNFYGGRQTERTAQVERLSLDLGAHRTQRLKTIAGSEEIFSATEHASVFNVLAAVLFAYLYRIHGDRRLSIGIPFQNRTKVFSETIGLFMEVFPLQIVLEENDSFLSVIRKIRAGMSEIRAFRGITLANSPRNRLYDVLLNYHTARFPRFHGMPVRQRWIHTGYENDALALQVHDFEGAGSFVLDFDFHCDVFSEAERGQAMRHFLKVLESFLEDPSQPLHNVSLLTPEEKQRILVEFNRSTWKPRGAQVLPRLFEAQAGKTPDRVALATEDQTLTYAALNSRANQLARRLRSLGAGAETIVALCAEPSPELLVGILGILKAGGAYLPLDPQYPKERLAFMLQDTGASYLVTEKKLSASYPHLAGIAAPAVVYLDDDRDVIARESGQDFDAGTAPGHLAYVIYTSGSTGTPKGVMIEHGAICNRVQWGGEFYGLNESDRVLQKSSFAFDASVWEIFEPLLAGARLVMARPGGRQNLAYLAELMAEQKVTVAEFAPSTLRALFEEGSIARCKSLKRVFSGGEVLTAELEKMFCERLSAELVNTYGPTEASVDVAHWKCEAGIARRNVPIGRPVAGMQIYILDARLQPVPVGVPGELLIGGVGVARGYLNRPELSAEKFVANTISGEPGARLYKTGDRARYLPDGNIEFLGRIDDQIKIRGFRIEPGEIEAMLSRHAAVRESVVVVRGDATREKRLVAYVVPHRGRTPATADLRSFLRSKLPEYMVPSAFILLEALPRTPHGKLDRRALPAPDQIRPELETTFVAPQTPVEKVLGGIFANVLGIERVGIRDDFFELGGHSLLATLVVSRIRAAFKVDLPLRRFFDAPTVAGLAEALLEEGGGRARIEKTARLVLEVARLSEDQAERMLDEKTSSGAKR
jgi:amino acid adenylation domain-containing protein